MSKKKSMSLSGICKNILMVCGVITALTGAAGGIAETVGKFRGSGDGEAAVGKATEATDSVVIEQRVMSPPGGGKVRVSKTVEVDSGDAGAATGAEVPGEVLAEMPITMSYAPTEKSLMERVGGLWGWMLGGGLGVVVSIIGLGWWVNRSQKESENEDTGSR